MPKTIPLVGDATKPGARVSPTIGKPDGPNKFVSEIGREVGTFTDPRLDLYKERDPGRSSLMHHVPFGLRGYYKPESTADYDPEEFEYIVDDKGYALCTAFTQSGQPCGRRAMNMSWLCSAHGGKLHPLDKVIHEDRGNMPTKSGGLGFQAPLEVQERMTRFQKLCQGMITVDDLDDEELARGQCRGKDGRFSNNVPRMIPKAVHDRMVNELFKRADEKLRENLIDVVETMTSIAKGEAYEPADRIKAATWVFERVRGKNPDVVVHQQDKPWELTLSAITTTTRAESRAARGLDPDTGQPSFDMPQMSLPGESLEAKRQRLLAELAALDNEPIDAEFIEHLEEEEEYADGEMVDHVDSEVPRFLADDSQPIDYEDGSATRGPILEEDEPLPGEKAEQHQDEVKSLKERLNAGRRQRAYARSQGREDIEETPFKVVQKGKSEDGSGYLVALKKQSTPGKKRGNDDYRHRI